LIGIQHKPLHALKVNVRWVDQRYVWRSKPRFPSGTPFEKFDDALHDDRCSEIRLF
jgi:hypothetical protein